MIRLLQFLLRWLEGRRDHRQHAIRERTALPDGTRVRLICGPCCSFRHHDGVWLTSWTPRRMNDIGAPDDYKLTRESDGQETFATRSAIEPVS